MRTLSRTAAAALLLALSAIACETPPDLANPRLFWSDGLTFRYPGNWSVTEEVEEEDGLRIRSLSVESPGNAIVLMSSFEPPVSMSLEEYAAEFRTAIAEEAGEMGRVGPWQPVSAEALSSGSTSSRIRGVPHEGLEYIYTLSLLGTDVPHVVRIFRVETDVSTTFLLAQAPAVDWSRVAKGFQLVVESFESR
jgi:hypothetical protein